MIELKIGFKLALSLWHHNLIKWATDMILLIIWKTQAQFFDSISTWTSCFITWRSDRCKISTNWKKALQPSTKFFLSSVFHFSGGEFWNKKIILQGVQDQIFQKEFAVPPLECISDPKLVNTKWVSSSNISYSRNMFFKNLENFCKMRKKVLVVWDKIRTHKFLITSLVL